MEEGHKHGYEPVHGMCISWVIGCQAKVEHRVVRGGRLLEFCEYHYDNRRQPAVETELTIEEAELYLVHDT